MKNQLTFSPAAKNFFLTLLLAIPYFLYVAFVIQNNRGPVDYETFMEIGSRIPLGKEVFAGNSYYPAPFVYVYTLLYLLPRPLSMILWLLAPVVAAWLISGRRPWVFLYGPFMANFIGGQSAIFAMLGMWGYLRNRSLEKWSGGAWLGLIAFKPQLVVFPALYAAYEWWISFRQQKKIPSQAVGFGCALLVWYLCGVPLGWDWPLRWISNPRPESFRPQAGILPRSLALLGLPVGSPLFWGGALLGFLILVWVVWKITHKRVPFDLWMFLAGCCYPLMHDYDLIQYIPLLNTPRRRLWALLASIPLWIVILFFYANDQAWFAVTLIPPVLAAVAFYESRKQSPPPIPAP